MTTDTKKRIRRNHTPALKAQVLAECAAPGASVASVAMAHGINANIVHGWRKLARRQGTTAVVAPAFVALPIEAAARAAERIHIEVRRGALSMTIAWPPSAVSEMTSWMRELLR